MGGGGLGLLKEDRRKLRKVPAHGSCASCSFFTYLSSFGFMIENWRWQDGSDYIC